VIASLSPTSWAKSKSFRTTLTLLIWSVCFLREADSVSSAAPFAVLADLADGESSNDYCFFNFSAASFSNACV